MNKNKKKLTLRTNTVRVLDATKLANAAGGATHSIAYSCTDPLCASGNAFCTNVSFLACSQVC